jgi:hypothetical protein
LFKQRFVESKTAWQRGIFAQNTSGSVDFCIKSDTSNVLAEFSKPRIGSEQVIKLYSNLKSFNLSFPLPKVHNFVCRSFPASAPAKYTGAPAHSSNVWYIKLVV